jgi:transposase
MKAWITTQHRWLTVERLPGYAHDLNPVEMVWGNVKDTIGQARAAAEAGLKRVSASSQLCFAFLGHTGLSL